ncbi:hypothetical protein AVEN_211287-1 [Araneus ventricosus]|uniref:Uncharacterized protein n=1 Tax=Araneus ventricosus TaxID=182803 RepID=A0A4Y2HP79_ARAVE|nr:hypothetical protein AVEN_211287-1 [Araneus ventricosus]
MFNTEASNPFGVLESLSKLKNPVDNLLKVISTQKNDGGAISKKTIKKHTRVLVFLRKALGSSKSDVKQAFEWTPNNTSSRWRNRSLKSGKLSEDQLITIVCNLE